MQLTSASAAPTTQPRRTLLAGETGSAMTTTDPRYEQYKVIRRNGAVVGFEPTKITIAVTKAFLAVNGGQGAASARVRDEVVKITDVVVNALMKRKPEGGAIHIEEIQDQVELALMRGGEHEVARAYVLYRERRSQERAHEKAQKRGKPESTTITVVEDGVSKPLDLERLSGARQGVLRGPSRRRARAHPQGDAEGPLQRRGDGGSAQVRRAGSAHADRKGSRVQLRHRAPPARLAAPRSARRRGHASRHGGEIPRALPRASSSTASRSAS